MKSRLESPNHFEMAICILRALQILCTLSSDSIPPQVECGECLYEREKNEMMERTRRSDNLTVFCCNASPKYRAPWSPIWLYDKLSVVSVCMKERRMRWWREQEEVMISLYFVVMLHRNIVHLELRFDCTTDRV